MLHSDRKMAKILKNLNTDYDRTEILRISDQVGNELKITLENAEMIEDFADALSYKFFEYHESVRIYLEILKIVPYRSSIYKKLIDIYFYNLAAINNFDFINNLPANNPVIGSVESIYACMSYVYMAQLLQRLGRFWESNTILNLALSYKNHLSQICKFAEYGNLELEFLSKIAAMKVSTIKSSLDDKSPLIIGTIFFGAQYVQLFCDSAAPTFFCQSNIDALKLKWNSTVVIFCQLSDKINLENSNIFKKISSAFKVLFIIIPDDLILKYPDYKPGGKNINSSLSYRLSGLLQTCMVILARKTNANLINLTPDAIYANTVVSTITNAVNNHYKTVFTTGLRLKKEDVIHYLSSAAIQIKLSLTGLSSTEIAKIALDTLHPATQASFVTNKKITYPGILVWPFEQKCLCVHSFQMHPIFISADLLYNSPVRRFDSIDGDFIQAILPNSPRWEQKIYVVTDSDQTMMFDLSDHGVSFETKFYTNNLVANTKTWVATYMRPLSFWLLKKRVFIGKMDASCQYLLNQADKVINDFRAIGASLPNCEAVDISFMLDNANKNLDLLATKFDVAQNSADEFITIYPACPKHRLIFIIKEYLLKCLKVLFAKTPVKVKRKILLCLKKLAIKSNGGFWEKFYYTHQKDRAMYNQI